MRRSLFLLVLSVTLVAASGAGCRNRRGGGRPRDAGPVPLRDSGPIGPADASRTEICGNGADDDGNGLSDCMDPVCASLPACATVECRLNSDCGSGETCEAGRCVPATGCTPPCPAGQTCDVPTRTCRSSSTCMRPQTVTAVRSPYCSPSTRTCIEGGSDLVGCLESDSNPDCLGCVNNNVVACANSGGCQSRWDDYACCINDNCPSDPSLCADTTCAGAFAAYNTCLDGVDFASRCPNAVWDCF